jgi:D-aspartate ligase
MADSSVPAVIVGLEYNGLGVARALASAGIPCLALATPRWNPACTTNACQVHHSREWSASAVIEDLIEMGRRIGRRAPLLITKDEPVLWISEARRELDEYFYINLPDAKTVDLLMDKRLFTAFAPSEGWPIPATIVATSPQELTAQMDRVVFPSIIKPAVKNSTYRRHSPQRVYRVFSEDDLLSKYDMIAQWEKEVVVQEWIEGDDDRITFCLTYYSADHRPLALFPGRKVQQCPIECGMIAIAEPCPPVWAGAVLDLTEKIMTRVKYAGLGSVEFKMRHGTDEPVIMEPTVGRTDFQNEVAVINGQNIPAIAYYDMINRDYYGAFSKRKKWRLVDGPSARQSGREYRRAGRMTYRQYRHNIRGPRKFMVFRINDMKPFLAKTYFTLRGKAATAFRFLIRR